MSDRREEAERTEKLAAHAAHYAAECAAGRHAWWSTGVGAKCMREGCGEQDPKWARGAIPAHPHCRTTIEAT